ncbi:HNH endonuclease [Paraburkholderia sp. MM5482-R1]|uniref:HNH endonuclease n=1 Tax=unclassified Paraburkholderia TaxID=2615204 RepID=UPI003D229ECF
MDDRLKRTIQRVHSWDDLRELELNIKRKDKFSEAVTAAIQDRASELGLELIAEKTGIDLTALTPAERKIVHAISEYVGVVRKQGKYPSRTLNQVRNRGLIDAAETAVSRAKPTQGFEALADADLENLSYERIVLDHPEEFSERARWFARRTLGLPNTTEKPPATTHSDTQSRTAALLAWLKKNASENDGYLPAFTNSDAAHVMGMSDMQRFGQVHGNIQSRIDFACFLSDLPPLGCAADVPFNKAWAQRGRDWAFPVADMQVAAQHRQWSPTDFDRVLRETERLPGQAHLSWKDALKAEQQVKAWALQFVGASSRRTAGGRDSRSSARLPVEILARATPEFVWRAVQQFLEGTAQHAFGPSTDFDVIADEGRRFPPKAVFGVGLSLALGGKVIEPKHFSGGEGSICFRLLRAAGYQVVPKGESEETGGAAPDSDDEWSEGNAKLVSHFRRERAKGLSRAKKDQYRRLHGKLVCERCGLDPVALHRTEQAEACIEVHHVKTHVSQMTEGHKSRLDDLQCLCANCHRLIHRMIRDGSANL